MIRVPKGQQIDCFIRGSTDDGFKYACEVVRVNADKSVDSIRELNNFRNPFEAIISTGKSGNGFDVGNQGPFTIALFGERTCEITGGGKILECD